jgi:hypothetical protein
MFSLRIEDSHTPQICDNTCLNMQPDNLLSLKDDMVAFIEGHGMRRFPGFVGEDVPSILWEVVTNPDSWKDFVEMAKTASAPFVTMSEVVLEKEDLEILIESIRDQNFPDEESAELDEVQFLVNYVGKLGYLQLGFAYQGVVYMHENSTPWYDRYQQLLEAVEDFGDIVIESGSGGEDDDS